MSRQNIVSTWWDMKGRWFFVIFQCKDGSQRQYRFSSIQGQAIEAGADPKDFVGVQTGQTPAAAIAEAAVDIAELLL